MSSPVVAVPATRTTPRFPALTIGLVAAVTFLTGIASPPHLMDDVDATQGQLARTMLRSGDWVTGRLDGVIFLDKAPLKYWITVLLYKLMGVHDWVARIPNALAVIALSVTVYYIGRWAGSVLAGYYAGLTTATSIGLFLFTRIVIPDAILTLVIALALWGLLRTVEERESDAGVWPYVFFGGMGCAVLLKGLIGLVFPAGIAGLYLLMTGWWRQRSTWKRLRLFRGLVLFAAIAVPWHALAILRNPPYFDLSLHAGDHFGYRFRGFFWFYFINDQILRFTNNRWPRDYNTVPRLWFWLYHLAWFFPWSLQLLGVRAASFRGRDRAARLHLLCLIWIGSIMLFFTLSTTQEYYSMPIYPAVALLIGFAMARRWRGALTVSRMAGAIAGIAAVACAALLIRAWSLPTPGDISDALSNNPDVYTLSLGHMTDLTFAAFAYLRLPLLVAAIAFAVGAIALWSSRAEWRYAGTVAMLVIFFQAARLAMVTFDPYLSSYPEAAALNRLPPGTLVFNGQYYDYSAVPFYSDYKPLLLNGRYFNLEYGSYAPDAPPVFIDDQQFLAQWKKAGLTYVITYAEKRGALDKLLSGQEEFLIASHGGKQLLANHAIRTP